MPIRAPRGVLGSLGRRATASFENFATARGVVVAATAATITPAANGSRERGRRDAVTYATETHAMMDSCLCKDVLAAAAKRCKSAPREGNHYATFGLAMVGDILDATRSRHTAKFGASHWIDRNALVSDAVKQMAATDLGALICMDVTSLDADRSGIITDEELVLSAQNGAIVGIITERDFLNAVANGKIDANTRVDSIMTSFLDSTYNVSRLVYVSPDMSVLAAMETMTQNRLRQVPVISSQGIGQDNLPICPRVLGVVSIGEVLKTLLAETRLEVEHLESFILGNHEYSNNGAVSPA